MPGPSPYSRSVAGPGRETPGKQGPAGAARMGHSRQSAASNRYDVRPVGQVNASGDRPPLPAPGGVGTGQGSRLASARRMIDHARVVGRRAWRSLYSSAGDRSRAGRGSGLRATNTGSRLGVGGWPVRLAGRGDGPLADGFRVAGGHTEAVAGEGALGLAAVGQEPAGLPAHRSLGHAEACSSGQLGLPQCPRRTPAVRTPGRGSGSNSGRWGVWFLSHPAIAPRAAVPAWIAAGRRRTAGDRGVAVRARWGARAPCLLVCAGQPGQARAAADTDGPDRRTGGAAGGHRSSGPSGDVDPRNCGRGDADTAAAAPLDSWQRKRPPAPHP